MTDTPQPGVIVCYATCWACKFGHCKEPATPHPWWDSEDAEAAERTGRKPPEGNCACPCANPATPEE